MYLLHDKIITYMMMSYILLWAENIIHETKPNYRSIQFTYQGG